ncbi:MAG: WD40/YVTN/BNR-like repeat-containing protein [Candidatus Dormibacteria bacterium]
MATERRRVARLLAAAPALLLLGLPATVHAAQPWWQPLGFAGQRVTDVRAGPGQILVSTAAATFLSVDGGDSFQRLSPQHRVSVPAPVGVTQWQIHEGTVVTGPSGQPLATDPGAPFLGASAQLIAAPAALPGVVVAVGTDNHVWRRSPGGRWATSFILLPAGGLAGTPRVTSLAAFTAPLTGAVYMGTDGYGVLLSQDGGDDWIRAAPGLPAHVLGLAADPQTRAVYAATDGGLFVHHLQSLPAPPAYHDASLYLRWLGMGAVGLLATALAVLALGAILRQTLRDRGSG